MGFWLHDLRYAFRSLIRRPGFSLSVILTLAFGLAGNVAVFSAIDALVLHPLPYPEPHRLVSLTKTMPMFDLHDEVLSPLDFQDVSRFASAFSGLAAIDTRNINLSIGTTDPERVVSLRVSSQLFSMLGAQPTLGRMFTQDDEQFGRHRVAILSESLWTRRFARDPRIVGKSVSIDGEQFEVVGVTPAILRLLRRSEIYTPLSFPPDQLRPAARGAQFLEVIGRLKPDMNVSRATDDLRRVADAMTQADKGWYPRGWSLAVEPLAMTLTRDLRPSLMVLWIAVGLVLLLACANVANLLIARAATRRAEIDIRKALGASGSRIAVQVLTESLVLAICAGVTGLLLAQFAFTAFARLQPEDLLQGQHLRLNRMVLLFALGVTFVVALVFGGLPAWRAARPQMAEGLRLRSQGSAGGATGVRTRRLLVAAQVGLSLVLLVTATLLFRSFVQLQQVDPGFRADGIFAFSYSLPRAQYTAPSALASFDRRLIDSLRTVPGVTSVASIIPMPFGGTNRGGSFGIVGRTRGPNDPAWSADKRTCSPDYFRTLGIPLREGRVFTDSDDQQAEKVVVVDEAFARQFKSFLPNQTVVGAELSHREVRHRIIGIVGSVKHSDLTRAISPTMYFSNAQTPVALSSLVIRSAGDVGTLAPTIRRVVRDLDPGLPVFGMATMAQRLDDSLARRRLALTLIAAFACFALVLTGVGIYGVMSYLVNQRQREIGLRMALGADTSNVVGLVMRQSAGAILIGTVVGLIGAFSMTQVTARLLYAVSPVDAVTLVFVLAVIVCGSLLASWLPARRAARISPIEALRAD